jgi:glutathione S-transferase
MKLLYQTHSPYARKVLVAAHEMGLHRSLEVVHHETSPTRRNEEVFALNPLGKVPVLICDDGTVLFDSNVICEYLDGLHRGSRLIPSHPQLRYRALRIQALAQGIADAGITARWESERRPVELRWPVMHDGQIQKIAAACDFVERELAVQARAIDPTASARAAMAVDRAASATTASGHVAVSASCAAPATGRVAVSTSCAAPATGRVAVSTSCAAPAAGHVAVGAARNNGDVSVTPSNTDAPVSAATATDHAAAHGNDDVSVTHANRHPDIGDIALATALSWIEFRRVYDFLTGRPYLAQWYSELCARPSMRATKLEGQTHD